MSDEDKKDGQGLTPDGDKTPDNEDDDELDDVDLQGQTIDPKVVQTLSVQKKMYRDKYKQTKEQLAAKDAEIAALKSQVKPSETPVPAPQQPAPQSDDAWRKKTDFLLTHRDFSHEDFQVLETISKGAGLSLEEAVKSPLWEGHTLRKQKEQQDAQSTPEFIAASEKKNKQSDELTPADKQAMQEFGLTEEQYKKAKAKFVSP